jgi:hypothetical protein
MSNSTDPAAAANGLAEARELLITLVEDYRLTRAMWSQFHDSDYPCFARFVELVLLNSNDLMSPAIRQ